MLIKIRYALCDGVGGLNLRAGIGCLPRPRVRVVNEAVCDNRRVRDRDGGGDDEAGGTRRNARQQNEDEQGKFLHRSMISSVGLPSLSTPIFRPFNPFWEMMTNV